MIQSKRKSLLGLAGLAVSLRNKRKLNVNDKMAELPTQKLRAKSAEITTIVSL